MIIVINTRFERTKCFALERRHERKKALYSSLWAESFTAVYIFPLIKTVKHRTDTDAMCCLHSWKNNIH